MQPSTVMITFSFVASEMSGYFLNDKQPPQIQVFRPMLESLCTGKSPGRRIFSLNPCQKKKKIVLDGGVPLPIKLCTFQNSLTLWSEFLML